MHQHSDHHWREHALCRRHDPELWWPVGTTGPAVEQAINAKLICRQCPVITDCFIFAMVKPEPEGIWAATDPEQRRTTAAELREYASC
jgi:WhiB family redox-sensing transcriptional regulator